MGFFWVLLNTIKYISAVHLLAILRLYVCGSVTAVTIHYDIGLLLCTEAPVMTPNDVDFSFLSHSCRPHDVWTGLKQSCCAQVMRLIRLADRKAKELSEMLQASLKTHDVQRVQARIRRHNQTPTAPQLQGRAVTVLNSSDVIGESCSVHDVAHPMSSRE